MLNIVNVVCLFTQIVADTSEHEVISPIFVAIPSMLCDSSINDSDMERIREELKGVDVYSCDLHKDLLVSTASFGFLVRAIDILQFVFQFYSKDFSQMAIRCNKKGKGEHMA
jgi:hypothetical protein